MSSRTTTAPHPASRLPALRHPLPVRTGRGLKPYFAPGTNMVRKELGLPEAECLAADGRYSLVPVAK